MSEQETTNEIEPKSTSVDMVHTDEVETPSTNILKNDTVAISDSSPSPKAIESPSKNLETGNSALNSSAEIGESLIEIAERISSEKVDAVIIDKNPEREIISSEPSINLISNEMKNEEKPSTYICDRIVSGEKLQPVSKNSKPAQKIKVLISSTSIDKSILEPVKDVEQNASAVSAAEDDENTNSEHDLVPKASSQQEINKSSLLPNETEKTQSSEQYAENVTYTDDGTAIYIDPKTQHKYKWSAEKNNWIAFDEDGDVEQDTNPTATNNENTKKSNPYENEHYRWCSETNQWIPKNTEQISSLTETEHYRWDAQKNEWIMKNQVPSLDDVTYGYEDGVRIYTDKDGMVFFWDVDKKAWFPKIDDDFLAKYQMSYGFIDNTTPAAVEVAKVDEEEERKIELEKKVEEIKKLEAAAAAGGVKRKAPPEPPKWFEIDQTQNTKVYVSNLPLDITMEEFSEIMSKCGMIMKDPQTQKQKLKLYTEKDGQLKGDGLCDYIKVESVDLALKLLDESIVRGSKIKVQRAKFQMRGEYNPTLKPKRKKKDKEKLIKMKEKLFDWRPEKMRGERSKHERTVIIKNLFTPDLFDNEVQLIIEYQNDLREECSKCGTVRKVVVYDRHAEGVAQINMADPEEADLVIQMMNGRFFGQRKLTAETWDGKTKYKVDETEEEIKARINKWDKYLEKGEAKEEDDDDDEEGDENLNETTKNKSDGKIEKVESVPLA